MRNPRIVYLAPPGYNEQKNLSALLESLAGRFAIPGEIPSHVRAALGEDGKVELIRTDGT